MAIYLGTNKVNGVYLGTSKVKQIYLGTNLVYNAEKRLITAGANDTGYTWGEYSQRFPSGTSGTVIYSLTMNFNKSGNLQVDMPTAGAQKSISLSGWGGSNIDATGFSTLNITGYCSVGSSYDNGGAEIWLGVGTGDASKAVRLARSSDTVTASLSGISDLSKLRIYLYTYVYSYTGTYHAYISDMWLS